MQEGSIDYYEYSDFDEPGCCLICPDAELGCLCYDCKCKKCYWYSYYLYSDEGECELALMFKQEKREEANSYSGIKVKNVISCNSKSVYGQVGNSKLIWIPLSVISNEGYIKNWFVDKTL